MTTSTAAPCLPRLRHRSRSEIAGWIIAVPVLVTLALVVATNENFEWGTVVSYLTVPAILTGIVTTLELTVVCMVLGVIVGVLIAVMIRSKSPLLSLVGRGYVGFFRGTPLLVQLIFWYNLAALFPNLAIGEWQIDVNAIITPFFAAVLGLALNEAAYMAEIVRGGLLAVDNGQTEAAEALGMRPRHVLTRVVLPQAMRSIIPPTGNQTIGMLKNTSLVSVLGASELLHSAQIIYSRTYETIPLLLVACFWYLVMTTVLSIGQYFLEKHFDKSSRRRRAAPPIPGVSTEDPATTSAAATVSVGANERNLP